MLSNTETTATIAENLSINLMDRLQLANGISNNKQDKLENLPSIIDNDTLNEIKNGGYGITLKDYTTLNTYKNAMSLLYGDASSDKFSNYLNKLYSTDNTNNANVVSVKEFLEKMRERGISNKSALKIYSAMQKYSATEIVNNSFVSAKI